LADKSWGGDGATDVRVRTNQTPEQRAAARAQARAARAAERLDSRAALLDERSARREAQVQEREAARTARRTAETAAAAVDPHADAARRPRASGRRDIVRQERDTSGYAVVVDHRRIRTLAARGASPASLAGVFALPLEDILAVLADANDDAA
jgi:hypothetical protein